MPSCPRWSNGLISRSCFVPLDLQQNTLLPIKEEYLLLEPKGIVCVASLNESLPLVQCQCPGPSFFDQLLLT